MNHMDKYKLQEAIPRNVAMSVSVRLGLDHTLIVIFV